MSTESYHTSQKQVYFKAYEHLFLLEDDLKLIKDDNSAGFQISFLGQVPQFCQDKNIEVSKDKDRDSIKIYWESILGKKINFGNFFNSEIGDVFVIGTLASTFLQKIDDKALGMLSAGPYGILRGIGASQAQATDYLKLLNNGRYLLILRGFIKEIENYRIILEQEVKG